MKRQQAGMTLISWVIVLGIIAFLATFVMRLFPMYQEVVQVERVTSSIV